MQIQKVKTGKGRYFSLPVSDKKEDLENAPECKYYAVKKSAQHYMGERYFKVNHTKKTVINICVNAGAVKKGRPYMFGVYHLSYNTFIGNHAYHKYKNLDEIPERIFNEQYKKVIQKMHKI